MITKKIVEDLYDPKSDGIVHLKNIITPQELKIIMLEIDKSGHLFEKKEEKYIENNQDVAIIYRGKFCLEGLNNTVFENVFKKYIQIRKEIFNFSEIPFTQGNVLEAKIIRYPISKLGVAVHRDLSSNVNLITFFNLFGKVKFYTYKNKEGEYLKEYLMEAGDASFMRGLRNENEPDIRPLHGVEEVKEERLVLAIREIRTDLEEITNKGNWRGF
jgi:hypothetical protein